MKTPEYKGQLLDLKRGLKYYVEQMFGKFPFRPDAEFPDIDETEEIPVDHDEVASVQFYKLNLAPGSDDHFGMRLNHRARIIESERKTHIIKTDLDFSVSPSRYDGTYTEVREQDDTFVAEIEDGGGAYELVLSVIDILHKQYPEQFPNRGMVCRAGME